MTKKILLIIGILVVIGVALFLVFGSKTETTEGNIGGFSIREYLPFGKSPDLETEETSNSEVNIENESADYLTNFDDNQSIPRLRKLSLEPVAGAVIFDTGTTSIVRFVEKGTGNVYEARSDSLNIQRLTNTTIPKIIRAFWLPNGSGFLAQTVLPESEIIETNFIKLNKNSASSTNELITPYSTVKSKLPTGIKELSIKNDNTKIFYYTGDNLSNWFVSNPDGTGSVLLTTNPLTEWLPKWLSGNLVFMQNKSSSETLSYTYLFNVSDKSFKKIGLGAIGFSSNPNTDGSLILVSGDKIPQLFLIDSKTNLSKSLETNTLAEKCVWLKEKIPSIVCAVPNFIPNGNYPDVWYKGLVATNDFIIKINTADVIFSNNIDLASLSDQQIDVVDLNISPNQKYLIFKNKIDGFLWMLRMEE